MRQLDKKLSSLLSYGLYYRLFLVLSVLSALFLPLYLLSCSMVSLDTSYLRSYCLLTLLTGLLTLSAFSHQRSSSLRQEVQHQVNHLFNMTQLVSLSVAVTTYFAFLYLGYSFFLPSGLMGVVFQHHNVLVDLLNYMAVFLAIYKALALMT